ncbi:MAG: DNA-3-methyladenine glycosylase I [Phycisphaerales bacterium]|nr:MAG: DNA-3-methyladenine glycosylase I [Phycisphaerales bacterium]
MPEHARSSSHPADFGTDDLLPTEDGSARCWWCGTDPQYIAYHDREWGRMPADDHRLFEKICLEGFQAGLSWLTILRKRDRFREVFHDFDAERIARFTPRDIDRLLADPGIVRHRKKIESVINNAQRYLELTQDSGSLRAFIEPYRSTSSEPPRSRQEIPAQTDASAALCRELKRRGWSFVGPTTLYAFMQSVGLVNDHLAGCHAREACETARNG